VAARIDELKPYKYAGIDEAHHASDAKSGDYVAVLPELIKRNPDIMIVAVTATPSRPDRKGLSPILQNAKRVTIGWAELERAGQIKLPHTVEVPIQAKNGGTVNQVARDHYKPEKDANSAGLMKKIREARGDDFNEQMANAWERQGQGLSTLAFAKRIEDARAFAEEMKTRGHRVDVVDSDSGADHNNAVLQRYGAGELDMVVSVKMIDEGLDVPATRCILILCETTSEIEYHQMVGRALRAGDDPELRATKPIVIDGGASTMIHGAIERRAAVIDYLQRLERGELPEAIIAKPLVETQANPQIQGVDGTYTPWRKMQDKPVVLALTDGASVVFAVESVDASGEPRYTLAETQEVKGRTQLTLMKGADNKPLRNMSGSFLQTIESERIIPSRATLLRMESTMSRTSSASLVDERIAAAGAQHIESVLLFAQMQARSGASR